MSADREAKTPVCASQSDRTSLAERVAPIQTRARALGLRPDGIDDKPLMDALSGHPAGADTSHG